ncbi:Lysophospholipase L1 [Amycolatopsis arida]|uniref:Lysophospholipase L1 n=1 Tax=Amycolatopsis arida TaxID=587909 RepID=A0A1I5LC59_9PSEU|nr:SGNH/GDSL hydrolase family protein [Amycolatopsis arida]TDX93670.1 lysophospholipase L1-like esterase [Amycolatopsis arida]SFO94954.1 Lysophospholipase L1 [Amycolatopsis arida]
MTPNPVPRRRTTRLARVITAVLGLLGLVAATVPTAPPATAHPLPWSGSWVAAVQEPSVPPWGTPNWSVEGFTDQSVRQVVRTSTGGVAPRIRLANTYGDTPLRLTGASVGKAGDGAAVHPGTLRPVTFRGSLSATVPAGAELTSDPVPLPVAPLERLSITLYFATPTGPATFHERATATSYRARGDHRFDRSAAAFTETSESWYFLSGVEVVAPGGRDAVATFGDSITDGVGSTVDADNRYPDELAERLVAARRPLAVLNAGISGNRVLNDSTCFGEDALSRFHRDVLDEPRVRTVIVLEGINDILFSEFGTEPCMLPNPEVSARELIEGHRALIRDAKARGVKVVGATLLPVQGEFVDSPRVEAVRDEFNTWLRTSGEYDAVVDLDRVMADPTDPDRMNPAYDSGDGIHPNDAGMRAMAEAIDLDTL